MINFKKILFLALVFFIFSPFPVRALETKISFKKGVGLTIWPQTACGTNDPDSACVQRLKNALESLGISWFYVWGHSENAYRWFGNSFEFIPMIWGAGSGPNRTYTQVQLDGFAAQAGRHPGFSWLIWNEPDLYSQANISPTLAASLYKPLREAIKRGDSSAKLIVGGFAYMDTGWLANFRSEYKNRYGVWPEVEGWAFHHYVGGDYNRDSWRSTLNNLRRWLVNNGQGSLEFWLTEFGSLVSEGIGLRVMQDQLEWLEEPSQSWITRYAWFSAGPGQGVQKGNLFNGMPDKTTFGLSALGEEYAIHPRSSVPVTPTLRPTASPSPSPSFPLGLRPSWNLLRPLTSINPLVFTQCLSGASRVNGVWKSWTRYKGESMIIPPGEKFFIKCH